MERKKRMVHLGFSDQPVPAGTHMCLIFSNGRDRSESLLKFLCSGLAEGERVTCISDHVSEASVRRFLAKGDVVYDERKAKHAIELAATHDTYFQGGVFDPERIVAQMSAYYRESRDMGFTGARVCGEMSPEVQHLPGGERLLEYESRISLLLRTQPVTAVCQYDANAFDGATIMQILRVHPQMVVNGMVVQNPFFIPPEQFLSIRR